jgi:hypothetical protein
MVKWFGDADVEREEGRESGEEEERGEEKQLDFGDIANTFIIIHPNALLLEV